MSDFFPRCPICGFIAHRYSDGYKCANPKCEKFNQYVNAVGYDVRKEDKNVSNNSSNTCNK